jgi:aconitate hydratase
MFKDGQTRKSLGLTGDEVIDISGIERGITPKMDVDVTITRTDGSRQVVKMLCRIDTLDEVDYFKNGGILHYVLRGLAA